MIVKHEDETSDTTIQEHAGLMSKSTNGLTSLDSGIEMIEPLDPSGVDHSTTSLPPDEKPPSKEERKFPLSLSWWKVFYIWLLASTFAPPWLPKGLRMPALGYVAAVLVQGIAILLTLIVIQMFPAYSFAGLTEILGVTVIALSWGTGPSLLSTLAGTILLNYVILPPRFGWAFPNATNTFQEILFLMVGLVISIAASQAERTRRKSQALAASLESERARFDAIIETVPDSVFIFDAQGTIVQINRMGRQLAGPARSSETLANSLLTYKLRTPEGKLFSLEALPVARAIQGEVVTSMEMRYIDAQGLDGSLSVSAAPLRDLQGKVNGAVAIMHDLSAQRKIERQAAERASELEAIFEALADGVFVISNEGKMLHMNTAFLELLGLNATTESDYYSQTLEQRLSLLDFSDEHGQSLPQAQWPQSRILRGETLKGANTQDMIFQTLDGRSLQINVSGAPVHNQEGKLIGALCICRDVTARRQLEKRTHEVLNALLAMAEALVSVPDDRKITGELTSAPSNKVAQRLVELTCSVLGCKRVGITAIDPETNESRSIAVVGLRPEQERQWRARTPGFQLHGLLADTPYAAKLQANETVILDLTQPSFSNYPNPLGIRVMLLTPMCVGSQLVGFLSIDHDGADHEFTEEEIALANAVAKLAALVIERERLLRERAEARATELALREANRRMDDFLGMTSHELKTPLTSIKGNTQLTLRQVRTSIQNLEKMQGMLEGTERQVRLLNRLVDDLLDISRFQANQLDLRLAASDPATIARQAIEEQRKSWAERTIIFDYEQEATISVEVDADRIGQVITNYLTNALKYSEKDRPVSVTLRREGEYVFLAVRDQGPGLSTEQQAQIWERFYRAPGVEVRSAAQSANVGLGLGLYISKLIIEQHGGRVGVQSTQGEGATFWFTLPLLPVT